MDLEGRVAIVTGAGRNVGRQIALTLAARGCDVVVNVGSRRDEAESVAAEIRAAGRRTVVAVADVSSSAEVEAMVRSAYQELGRIDVLVNCAAIRPHAPLEAVTDELWARVIGVNLSGAFYCCRAVAPLMTAAGRGSIVNVSGAATLNGGPHDAHIVASKAGLEGLTRALAVELGPRGIRVNTLLLSSIDTVRGRPSTAAPLERVPLRRRGSVTEVAEVCAFLASDASSYVTGQMIPVTGGSVMR